jgi:hypothetical protein
MKYVRNWFAEPKEPMNEPLPAPTVEVLGPVPAKQVSINFDHVVARPSDIHTDAMAAAVQAFGQPAEAADIAMTIGTGEPGTKSQAGVAATWTFPVYATWTVRPMPRRPRPEWGDTA